MPGEFQNIAVIGAGIVGVSSAEWLRRDGHNVTIIDRLPPGEGTSFGNGGVLARCGVVPVPTPGILGKAPKMLLDPEQPLFVRWSYLVKMLPWLRQYLSASKDEKVQEISDGLVPLLEDAVNEHLALAKGTEAEAFIHPGDYIFLYQDEAGFENDSYVWNLRRKQGFIGAPMDRSALIANDPALGERYHFGYKMQDHGHIADPGGYVKALARHFESQGGHMVQADVKALRSLGEGTEVVLDGGAEKYDRVVIAGGAWSAKLAESLGHNIPLETERGYHIHYLNPNVKPPCPYMVADSKFVATPMADGLRTAGIVEFGGLEAPPSKGPITLLEKGVRKLYPDFEFEEKREWLGHRPAPADSLPFLGPSSHHPSVYCAFGHHHVGLTAGPKTGRMIADMVSDRLPNIDIKPYRVDRFD
ncbi:FAD-binding oxidoreductase [Sneathiella marina]|uniref:FAD-binding oxidoreductase n=1 Tax=Sneathiella marina TaxID=2950108 RepID=A0ABY4W2U2_9PROT|nr:FAD-binding oxidoreductase [Sneathiella marina]USG61498.1 FAD-binding oxidoreductase [Sneathiella marina]